MIRSEFFMLTVQTVLGIPDFCLVDSADGSRYTGLLSCPRYTELLSCHHRGLGTRPSTKNLTMSVLVNFNIVWYNQIKTRTQFMWSHTVSRIQIILLAQTVQRDWFVNSYSNHFPSLDETTVQTSTYLTTCRL
jgi:hypothetical protein